MVTKHLRDSRIKRWTPLLTVVTCVLLAAGVTTPAKSAFPGANGLIAYQYKPPGSIYQVYTMRADGSDPTKITSGGQSFTPAFSPDGRQLAVFRLAGDQSGVWIVDLDGTWIRKLAAFPGDLSDTTAPAWSPDGQQIVYTLDDELWIANADGTGAEPVFDPGTEPEDRPGPSYSPAWSPDGSLIAFNAYDLGLFYITVVAPDGTGMTRLTKTESVDPNWSPDGSKIAYSGGVVNSDIWVMDADGSNKTRLTFTSASVGREGMPAWSPNGQEIAFYDQQAGALYTIKPDGAGRQVVRKMPQGAGVPDWQSKLRAASSLTLNVVMEGRWLRARGALAPEHPGKSVAVKLFRNDTFFRKKTVTLNANSVYVAEFPRLAAGTCKFVASFPGDRDHLASTKTETFPC